MDEKPKTLLEYVSEVRELNEISEYMKDPLIDEAMGYVVKLTVKEEILSLNKVGELITKLQAMSGLLHIKAKYYTLYDKDGANTKRKNTYYSMEDTLDKIVNALKYIPKG